ncbi:MAG: apolipoprotein N-acyltransferase [Verrucomicrobiia bacterium]
MSQENSKYFSIQQLLKNRFLHSVFCGILWALAFPDFEISGLAYVAPAYLFFIITNQKPADAFRYGYLAGLVQSLISLCWLLYIPVKIAPIAGWLALAAYLAAYPALWCWLCNRVYSTEKIANKPCIKNWFFPLLAGIIWVGLEMIRARFLTGFPWNPLGASQYRILPIIQISAITGVYGVSFLIVWLSVALAIAVNLLIKNPLNRWMWLKPLVLPVIFFALASIYGICFLLSRSNDKKSPHIRVALVQPSIPQTMIWDKNENSYRFRKLLELSRLALAAKPDILILPEAAVPGLFRYDEEIYRSITTLAQENNVWMIIGADDAELSASNTNKVLFYNCSFLISPRGFIEGRYAKQHLVIFGEYVPLSRFLPFLKYLTPIGDDEFTPGEKPVKFRITLNKQSAVIRVNTSTVICFEDVIPHLVRNHIFDDLDFLVNLTNDGWFKQSSAQRQHAANAVFRSVENRVPLIRCTNNGLTCWIDEAGMIHDEYFGESKDIYGQGFKIVSVPLRGKIEPTVYTKYGDWFGYSCLIISILIILATKTKKNI